MAAALPALRRITTVVAQFGGSDCGPFRNQCALALFGAGLGMFIAPNNSATVAAVPANRTGVAGGMLNLMRALGCAIGTATASVTLSWRL
jgi:hypothetical protein